MAYIIFLFLFSRSNLETHKTELENRAIGAASNLSIVLEANERGGRRMGMGRDLMELEVYLRFIGDIADVWIIDRNFEVIIFERRRHEHDFERHDELPYYARQVANEVFEIGAAIVGESSEEEHPSVFAAAPIFAQNGVVLGVVLLRSHVFEVNAITSDGLALLAYSVIAAIFLSIIFAAALSSRFIAPLNKMKNAARRISDGDYSVRTGVSQTDEIGELANILDETAKKLLISSQESQKLDKLRKDFIANISHELRTPITVIRASLEAICDGIININDGEKIKFYNNQMLAETRILERLVNDLLDLARLQNLDFKIEKTEIDLKSVLEDAIRSIGEMARRKKINIIFNCALGENEKFFIWGDYARLRQMFVVVLDNAIKFSEEGKTTYISLLKNHDTLIVKVRDEGRGIDPVDLPYIFERFYKQRSEHNKTGSGLGLAIAKQIADRHDVNIKAISELDKGTEIIFEF